MSNIKTIYEFTVNADKENNGIIEKVPTFFAFKKPSRVEREDAQAYRVAQYGEFIKKGILPLAILSKTYSNFGGILDEVEREKFLKLRASYVEKEREYQISKAGGENEKADLIMNEMLKLNDDIVRFEHEQSSFFNNTAEAKARNKHTEYLILHMSYWRTDVNSPWVPYFKGVDAKGFEPTEKYAAMDEMEEAENPIFIQAFTTLALIATFYVMTGGVIKADEVKTFLSDNDTKPTS